jgi:hypothetical protein
MPRDRRQRSRAISLLSVAPVFVLLLGMVVLLSSSRASKLTSGPVAAPASGFPSALPPTLGVSASATPKPSRSPKAHRRHHGAHSAPSARPTPAGSSSAPPPGTPPSANGHSDCAGDPGSCGFPDAANTGVPAGLSLRTVPGQVSKGAGWHYDPRGWVEVTGSGTVLKGLYIPYNVDVSASNVTIEDVRIVVTGESFGVSLRHTHNVTIEDTEISSPDATGSGRLLVGIKDIYGDTTGTVVRRDNIWHTSTAVQMSTGVVEDTYIHDLGFKSGDHLNGITSNGSDGSALVIQHNTVFNNYQQTDAIGLFEDFGAQSDCLIEDNLLAGGGYTVYGGANPGGAATSGIRIIDNRFARLYSPNSGYYGPVAAFASSGAGNEWAGNVWDNTNKVLGD